MDREWAADWSEQKKLCYDARAHVMNALSFIEGEDDERKAERWKMATMNIKAAAEEVQRLFKVICEKEMQGTP